MILRKEKLAIKRYLYLLKAIFMFKLLFVCYNAHLDPAWVSLWTYCSIGTSIRNASFKVLQCWRRDHIHLLFQVSSQKNHFFLSFNFCDATVLEITNQKNPVYQYVFSIHVHKFPIYTNLRMLYSFLAYIFFHILYRFQDRNANFVILHPVALEAITCSNS